MATFVNYRLPGVTDVRRPFLVVSGDPANDEAVDGFLFLKTGDNASGYGSSETTHVMYCEGVTKDATPEAVGGTYA